MTETPPDRPSARPGFFRRLFGGSGEEKAGSGQSAVGSGEEVGSGPSAVGSGEESGSGPSAVGSRGEAVAAPEAAAPVAEVGPAEVVPLIDAEPAIATGAEGATDAGAPEAVMPAATATGMAEAAAEQRRRGFFGRLFGRRDAGETVEPPPPPAGPVVAPPSALQAPEPVPPPVVAHPSALRAPEPVPPPVVAHPSALRAPETAPPVVAHPSALRAPEPPPPAAPLPEFLKRADAAPVAVPPPPVPPAALPGADEPQDEPAPLVFSRDVAPEPEPEAPQLSWWQRLKGGLARTSSSIGGAIGDLFTKRKLDAATLDDLEDILIQADLGLETAARVVEAVSKGRYGRNLNADQVKQILAEEVEAVLKPVAQPLLIDETQKPFVILVVGVNGAGKTTTIGKLAAKIRREGRTPMLVAGDTFRAAAIEQLKIWGERTKSPVLARPQGSDASGLAFDALTKARAEGIDVLLVDTAGRLQNKTQLMAELEKIVRVMRKVDDSAPHAVLLVLDATVGQNALSQIEAFHKTAGVTGLVMTKLDGTARGGILVAASARFGLPVHFIGVGEGVDDLEAFEAEEFARAVAGLD